MTVKKQIESNSFLPLMFLGWGICLCVITFLIFATKQADVPITVAAYFLGMTVEKLSKKILTTNL